MYRKFYRLFANIFDISIVPLAWFLAYCFRFNFATMPTSVLFEAAAVFSCVFPIQVFSYWFFGLHRSIWRYASMTDLLRIVKASIMSVCLLAAVLFMLGDLSSVPRSILPLYLILLVILQIAPRVFYRWLFDRKLTMTKHGKKALIVGAGRGGESIIRDMLRSHSFQYHPVAVVDDDLAKQGQEIHGVRVVGKVSDVADAALRYQVDMIIIAIPAATSPQIRAILELIKTLSIPVRILPGLEDLVSGRVDIDSLREVKIEDLLGRDVVHLANEAARFQMHNKTVLVSGGGGSIGSELCAQIATYYPDCLIVVDNSEFNLYKLNLELSQRFPQLNISQCLVNVADKPMLKQVFEQYQPNIVFHAAAYKHVPMLESQLQVAIKNNIIGTQNIADLSDEYQAEKFVLVSTDKAVNPTNIMGTTKRSAEIYCQAYNSHSKTKFISVRFGNVLGSVGSVVPLFEKQLKAGGPLTVTHPDMTRFFMTIPEAASLILQAFVIGGGGEIFVLDMGESVRIQDLAKRMIELAGKTPNEDIMIEYTGLRAGEKLYEELFYDAETLIPTGNKKISQALASCMSYEEVQRIYAEIQVATLEQDERVLSVCLAQLVPCYAKTHAKAAISG
jgi:FlaA1/EpsC-like NDP-sugar epimerase